MQLELQVLQADRVMEGRNLFTKSRRYGTRSALAKGSEFVGEAGRILRIQVELH